MRNSNKVLIVIIVSLSITVFYGPIFTMAYIPPEPPISTKYYATSVTEHPGDRYSGNEYSLKYNDGNEYVVICDWWWAIVYIWEAEITIDYPNKKADKLYFELTYNGVNPGFVGSIKYTSGSPQSLAPGYGEWPNGWLESGQYTYTLNSSRKVDKVVIHFWTGELLGGDKYVKIDYAYLLKN